MAISPCIFNMIWPEKRPLLGGHFPLESRAHLYIFGISGARRMGKHTELKSNPTFYFFAPPPSCMRVRLFLCVVCLYMHVCVCVFVFDVIF